MPEFQLYCISKNGLRRFIWLHSHDYVIKWKHFPRYWPFVRGIHRSSVNSPHKGQWRGALMFFFYLRLIKRLSKHSRGWWFETPLRPLWRHCNACFRCPLVAIMPVGIQPPNGARPSVGTGLTTLSLIFLNALMSLLIMNTPWVIQCNFL